MASAHTLPLALDKCLRAGFFNVDDPGSAGTISIDRGKGIEVICVVVTAGAETRTLPDTTSLPVNQRILIVFKTDGGDLTITGNAGDDVVLQNAGEVAEFVVSDNNGTKEWQRIIASTALTGSTLDLNGGADALILDADADTTLSAPTDDQIDVEIAGADDFTFTANSFNVLTGSDIDLADSAKVKFGTGDDITMAWDGTDFDILQAGTNSSIKWGVDGAGMDQVWYGDTASESMTWDQSADDLVFTAAAGIVGATGVVPFIPDAKQEAIAAGNPGAISVTTYLTTIGADAGGDAFTLADGGQKGQLKKIVMDDATGTGTVTITTPADENTLTFDAVGETAVLLWNGAAWRIIQAYNEATGGAGPGLTTV